MNLVMNKGSRLQNCQAFTLMELAIALLVFLIGILGLLQLVVYSVSVNQRSRDITLTTSLAQQRADDLLKPSLAWTSAQLTRGGVIPTTPNTNPLMSGNPAPVSGYADFFDYNGNIIAVATTPIGNALPVPTNVYFVRQWQVCDGCGATAANICSTATATCSPISTNVLKRITVTVTAISPAFRGSYPSTTVSVYRTRIP